MGLDLSGWLDNNPDFTLRTESDVTIHLQDKWEYSDIIPLKGLVESKYEYVVRMLEKAREGASDEWFVNFMSAVGDPVRKGEVAESHVCLFYFFPLLESFLLAMRKSLTLTR